MGTVCIFKGTVEREFELRGIFQGIIYYFFISIRTTITICLVWSGLDIDLSLVFFLGSRRRLSYWWTFVSHGVYLCVSILISMIHMWSQTTRSTAVQTSYNSPVITAPLASAGAPPSTPTSGDVTYRT
ncbi:hypothetical protein HOY80DRAFT_958327 [Tuber brumale]|nr:hypothetical protein HOY80DRAFT_958327 [Tuber brumale]